jgi:hypothetical protein
MLRAGAAHRRVDLLAAGEVDSPIHPITSLGPDAAPVIDRRVHALLGADSFRATIRSRRSQVPV